MLHRYYIVQQGKVSALCTARDADRLALLKEVGGAGVYEQKRAEAARTCAATNHSSVRTRNSPKLR